MKWISYISPYLLPLELSATPHPTPLGSSESTELELPRAIQQLPTSCFTYGSAQTSVLISQFIASYHGHTSTPCVCISAPAQLIGSSVSFFLIPHVCVNVYGICFSMFALRETTKGYWPHFGFISMWSKSHWSYRENSLEHLNPDVARACPWIIWGDSTICQLH